MGLRTIVLGVILTSMVVGGVAITTLAKASTLTPDFNALSRHDTTALRDGDFDGDGRVDELYLVSEADTGRVAIHVRLNKFDGAQDVRVTSLDTGNAAPNIHVVGAGVYAADCGTYTTECASAGVRTTHDSFIVSLDSDTSVLLHWQTDHFETDFVRNDEARMAHALSALYALNP
ncbi:hypothetical protein [Asticcacaulis sp. 201]|uniref:hypothetical protein n=1 Tax=Asticcacaulis sp. 201 TaxID=3028787 RepID=UPI00291662C4|nr:hypothetical protein [Asticcacaulis sp. 201]MDV6331832.1 hypothetical protein [Asticcacaulis sp. 201]